ncbi:ABC transporter permease [Candidatus Saccharibacteria bacterium]|nr:ABC transporter permease [Candidatus Saccharibacteria bacterium]
MFLAVNELLREKQRFLLITSVIILVGYLTFFLTGLAYGLATSYTQGIDKWNAEGIILQKDANNNIARSLLTESDYKNILNENTALLGVGSATVKQDKTDDVSLFGIDMGTFLAPNITEGRLVEKPNEVVISDALRSIGLQINQELKFKGSSMSFVVVGFADKATFQTAPIVYMQQDVWRGLVADLAGMNSMQDETTVSAIITKDVNTDAYNTDNMSWQSIKDFSFKLPGYQAQVLTFGLMISFLIAIASLVLAIFMYVLTLQKKSIFGVLKAEGIPSSYIARSVMIQIIILSALGLVIGVALTILSSILLGSKVPFLINPQFFMAIFILFLVFAAIGGIASVRSVAKIDPVEAIG